MGRFSVGFSMYLKNKKHQNHPSQQKVFVVSGFPHAAPSDPCDANQVSVNSSSFCPCVHHLAHKRGMAGGEWGRVWGKYGNGSWIHAFMNKLFPTE